MSSTSFKQVDVFTSVRFKGNPVAVVLRADDLTTQQMQRIANWTNLSETTFVLPSTDSRADYRVRIFTPGAELPFAGHPTIGTAHALLEAGLVNARDGVLVQECGAGLIKLAVTREASGEQWISFDLPQPGISPLNDDQVNELEAIVGSTLLREYRPALVDVGARWIVAQLPSAQAVLSSQPDLQRMKVQDTKAKATGVVIFGEYDRDASARIEVRAFAPACGVNEDPVCGGGNGSVGAFIRHTKQTARFGNEFRSSQGAVVGRAGVLCLTVTDQKVRVGGVAVTCIDGRISV